MITNLRFNKCNFEDIQQFISKYKESLSSPIDSYLEDHILESVHFLINLDEINIGYCSIYNKELLSQYYIEKQYRALAQKVYLEVKRLQNVRFAYVSTSDEFFLSHALDNYEKLDKQAYFFHDNGNSIDESKIDKKMILRQAVLGDKENILKYSGDFFESLDRRIAEGQIYVAVKEDTTVGFGIIEKGRILKDYASIGMYVVEEFRQDGIGRNILLRLKEEAYKNNLKLTAGCWYYNHLSKKTLESAGMYSNTRLLKVSY